MFFLNNNPSADPHGLDADDDGVVCESNPGPYYYGSDPNPGGGGGGGGGGEPAQTPSKPRTIKVVKVLQGDLLLLRRGPKPAFKVRLLGAEVRGNSCMRNGSKRDLKKWIKPGRVVWLDADRRAPKRDRQGHLLADVITERGDWTIPGTQLDDGWATLPEYKFTERRRYKRWAEKAEYMRKGHYAKCVKNFGTTKHPYEVGTSFDFGPWRYEFGLTDIDALPEMQAENAAAPGTVVYDQDRRYGYTYARVPVTITRIGSGSGSVSWLDFEYHRRSETYDQFSGDSWCGTGDAYIDDQTLSQGQTLTGFVCATVPSPVGGTDMWTVDAPDLDTSRFISVH
ncbi:hypothetical protein [Nocardioides xinjiangensis]|uniref:hypothetical protein n=1 Tax=Nocardioides xinjiangensis TaxID=2817376 RepID=UPI001FED710B